MLTKVISGGQSGADLAGLLAAKEFGIPTGGSMPKGFITLEGPKPEYAELFGIEENPSDKYPPRTYQNAAESDGTLRFAKFFQSAGELCTLKAIMFNKKPYFDVPIRDTSIRVINERYCPQRVAEWIKENQIYVLNVAGNSEKTCPGIQEFVRNFLLRTFSLL